MRKRRLLVLLCCCLLFTMALIQPVSASSELWNFNFSLVSKNPFPNPIPRNSAVKAKLSLCVVDKDFNFHPATIRTRVTNDRGQQVYTKTELHDSSPEFIMEVFDTTNIARGNYFIQVRAETSFGNTSSWLTLRQCRVY
ncbi:hypothetical protein [Vallitalea guaymasensis]|uniref:hypothetical protein n=1 Tax=Vallitalea guaymasensis TaxID=1185412 RepID=UPI002354F3B1|nr:hypothetical protein [Vallitalea guaymasensis]